MKYILFVILCSSLLFTSCVGQQKQSIPTNNTVESMYYFYLTSGILYKYNMITGETSTVCTDPVCKHDSDCFFSNVNYVLAHENTIFFTRSDTRTITTTNDGLSFITESICSFDYASGKRKELCNLKSGVDSAVQGMLEFYEEYIYFYRQTPDPKVIEYSLYRVPSDGGDVEDMGLSAPMWHGAHYNNRLFFFDNIDTLYSTDIYGENRFEERVLEESGRIVIMRDTSDGYLYYSVIYDNLNEVWRMDIESNEHQKLYETDFGVVSSLYRVDEKLYFLIAGEEIEYGTTNEGRRLTDPYSGKVYSIDLEKDILKVIYDEPDSHILYLRKCGNAIIVFTNVVKNGILGTERFILDS